MLRTYFLVVQVCGENFLQRGQKEMGHEKYSCELTVQSAQKHPRVPVLC